MNKIFIKYLNEIKDLYRIEKATKGSAGFDLLASINDPVEISPGRSLLIPCGFSLQMPANFERFLTMIYQNHTNLPSIIRVNCSRCIKNCYRIF